MERSGRSVRLGELNKMDRTQKTPIQIEAIEKETRGFECPSCHEHFQFRVTVAVKGIQPTLTGEEVAERDGRPLMPKGTPDPISAINNPPMGDDKPSVVRLLHYYKDIGILDAFEQVLKEHFADKMPKDIGKFFLTFLRTSVKASLIPKLALRRLINEFDDGLIEVYTAQQIAAVVSDGKIRCFVPAHLLRGEVVRLGGGSNTKMRTRATEERLDTWIRTKHGYVFGAGPMFQEMQKQARGSFDNVA